MTGEGSTGDPQEISPEALKRLNITRRAVVLGLALSGAAALIYEVAWTRELSLVFGSTIYAVSMMLTAFMAGLSIGSTVGGRMADRQGTDLVTRYALVEASIGVFGLLTIPLIHFLPRMYFSVNEAIDPSLPFFFALQLLMAFLVMVIPTALMGATFPLASKIVTQSYQRLGRSIGDIYSVNTLGSIAGSFAAGFILIPIFGVRAAIFAAAGLNFVIAAFVLYLGRRKRFAAVVTASLVALAMATGVSVVTPEPVWALGFGIMARFNTYDEYARAVEDAKIVFEDENAYSRVVVTEDSEGMRTLCNGGFIEGGQRVADVSTTVALAELPAAFTDNRGNGLVIGLGTGYTTAQMLSLGFDSVETIEINPAVPMASKFFVGNSLEDDKRWHLKVDDARAFINHTETRYDVITSEPSWPLSSSVTPLFTKEFFSLAKARLNPDGVFCQWLPQYLVSRRDFEMMYKTVHEVFPNVTVWRTQIDGEREADLLFVGVNSDAVVDPEVIRAKVNQRMIDSGLPSVTVTQLDAPQTLREALSDPSVGENTDDHPILEFAVIRNVVERIAAR